MSRPSSDLENLTNTIFSDVNIELSRDNKGNISHVYEKSDHRPAPLWNRIVYPGGGQRLGSAGQYPVLPPGSAW